MEHNDNVFDQAVVTTILVVSDLQQSKKFYLDALHASLYREYGGTSVVISFLQSWFLLVTPGGPTVDKPKTHFIPPADPDKVSHAFTIRVSDCNAVYAELKNRDVAFITPPHTSGNETRCFFRDPDGHLFEISEFKA